MCVWLHGHDGEVYCCPTTCLDVCAECPPRMLLRNFAVKLGTDAGEQIPCGLWTASRTFSTFCAVVHADSHPECSLSLTDDHLSLKHLYQKKKSLALTRGFTTKDFL